MTPRERLMRFALASLANRYELVASFANHLKKEYGLEGTTPPEIIASLHEAIAKEEESVRITG